MSEFNPREYLSYSPERGWLLIYQGSPLCDYKKTLSDVLQVAKHYRITLPDVTWMGDLADWKTTNDIEVTT